MRLTDLIDREHAFKYAVGFVLAVIFLIVVAVPARSLSGFYLTLDELSDSVRRNDFDQAETKLSEATAFYESSRAWGLESLADSYLFREAFLQQGSYSYLTGDYETVVNDLADDVDDPRASYLLASAKFQLARIRYRAIPADDADAEGGVVLHPALVDHHERAPLGVDGLGWRGPAVVIGEACTAEGA